MTYEMPWMQKHSTRVESVLIQFPINGLALRALRNTGCQVNYGVEVATYLPFRRLSVCNYGGRRGKMICKGNEGKMHV